MGFLLPIIVLEQSDLLLLAHNIIMPAWDQQNGRRMMTQLPTMLVRVKTQDEAEQQKGKVGEFNLRPS